MNQEKLNVKGALFTWNEQSVRWYEEASDYTHYHEHLREHIAPHLNEADDCCELACGTGSLARVLAPLVHSYTANDIDPHAAEWLRCRIEEHPQPNLSVCEGDWHEVLKGRHFNAVIFSYFGAVLRDWEALQPLTDRLIVITPRMTEEELRRRQKRKKKDVDDARVFENYDNIIRFFEERQIPYTAEPLDLEFGQPFSDREAARAYVTHYYRLEGADADEFIDVKMEKKEDGFLFYPKTKKIGLITAEIS